MRGWIPKPMKKIARSATRNFRKCVSSVTNFMANGTMKSTPDLNRQFGSLLSCNSLDPLSYPRAQKFQGVKVTHTSPQMGGRPGPVARPPATLRGRPSPSSRPVQPYPPRLATPHPHAALRFAPPPLALSSHRSHSFSPRVDASHDTGLSRPLAKRHDVGPNSLEVCPRAYAHLRRATPHTRKPFKLCNMSGRYS